MDADVAIIGGSYAGMAAALQLVRARRRVTLFDTGVRRNRFAAHAHGFLGQDGRPPGAIAQDARDQLLAYPTLTVWEEAVSAVSATDEDFALVTESGSHRARRVVLAYGVIDELPAVNGLAERWGKSVFHCPYCHGYELGGRPVGVLAVGEVSLHHALMLPDWGETTLFLNDAFAPDTEQLAQLARRQVRLEPTPIDAIEGEADVRLRDGRVLPVAGLFTATRIRPASPIAEQLGCRFERGPTGPYVATDGQGATSVPGVFACGDLARAAGAVALSVGDGTSAGMAAHRSLILAAAQGQTRLAGG